MRPKLGAAAVRALIEAGREAVRVRRDTVAAGKVGADAAVTRLVGQLDDFTGRSRRHRYGQWTRARYMRYSKRLVCTRSRHTLCAVTVFGLARELTA